MTKKECRTKLRKAGYRVSEMMGGKKVIATKGCRTYMAKSLNEIVRKIF